MIGVVPPVVPLQLYGFSTSVVQLYQPTPVKEAPRVLPKVDTLPKVSIPVERAGIPVEWWNQGSDSPIAIAIGAAEGTRRPDGSKNPAYYWHADPGNGADNFGTFSYQHLNPEEVNNALAGATNTAEIRDLAAKAGLPEKADALQLKRLKGQAEKLIKQANDRGYTLTQFELIVGLDLANQSPLAALSVNGGYIERLWAVKNKTQITDPIKQVIEARTWSYWNPNIDWWDAPGLGNTEANIRYDQDRRVGEIVAALKAQGVM